MHQLSNDLQLEHGVNWSKHLFTVTPEGGRSLKYHVVTIPSNGGDLHSFEAIFNQAMDM